MNPSSIWQSQQPKIYNQLDFDIEDPSSYYCNIYKYWQGHHVLVIAVRKQNDSEVAFYIGFEGVWYFEGPTSWNSIDFELGDINERIALLQKGILNIEDNMINVIADHYLLFTLQKPAFKIQRQPNNPHNLNSLFPCVILRPEGL